MNERQHNATIDSLWPVRSIDVELSALETGRSAADTVIDETNGSEISASQDDDIAKAVIEWRDRIITEKQLTESAAADYRAWFDIGYLDRLKEIRSAA